MDEIPLVPAVWVFGRGSVMTGAGKNNQAGCLVVRAVPDDAIGKPVEDAWDRCAELSGPQLILAFTSPASIDAMIATLGEVKEALLAKDQPHDR